MTLERMIEEKKSVRVYKEKSLKSSDLKTIKAHYDDEKQLTNSAITLHSFDNGDNAAFMKMNGHVGYNGILIHAPHYFVFTGESTDASYLNLGYVGERLAFKLHEMGIGSVWLDVQNSEAVKSALGVEGDVLGVLAAGYEGVDSYTSKTRGNYKNNPHINVDVKGERVSSRLGSEDIVFLDTFGNEIAIGELSKRGLSEVFRLTRLAPSWGNRQPWRFIIDDEKFVLVIDRDDQVDDNAENIEAGIAMLYFEFAMRDSGYPGYWHTDHELKLADYKIPEGNFVAGYYTYR